MDTKKNLREKIQYEKNMKEYYREQSELFKDMYDKYVDLFDRSIKELTVKNMMVDNLLNSLDEIKSIDEDNIVTALAENTINRHNLDVIINNRNNAYSGEQEEIE